MRTNDTAAKRRTGKAMNKDAKAIRTIGGVPPTYNISGAAAKLGKAPSTIVAAIEKGELAAIDGPIGGDCEPSRVVAAIALSEYRDRLVARLATHVDAESRAEADRLRDICI